MNFMRKIRTRLLKKGANLTITLLTLNKLIISANDESSGEQKDTNNMNNDINIQYPNPKKQEHEIHKEKKMSHHLTKKEEKSAQPNRSVTKFSVVRRTEVPGASLALPLPSLHWRSSLVNSGAVGGPGRRPGGDVLKLRSFMRRVRADASLEDSRRQGVKP